MTSQFRSPSLLWRILLATSIAATVLFAGTAWMVLRYAVHVTAESIEEEVHSSLREYQSIWQTKAETLSKVSQLMSRMPDVRAAFMTGNAATIKDSLGEIWERVSQEDAFFSVYDPEGREIASLSGLHPHSAQSVGKALPMAAKHFPEQAAGFLMDGNCLHYTLITPVYVQTPRGPALLNVLVAGFEVNDVLTQGLKRATQGSDFVFLVPQRVAASTLNGVGVGTFSGMKPDENGLLRVVIRNREYRASSNPLLNFEGGAVGTLLVMRSTEASNRRLAALQRNVGFIWTTAVIITLLITYSLARRIIEPLRELDAAAARVAQGNYETEVRVSRDDELGRLARTFNSMCASIRFAREELISKERINTIGRLSSSIIHDLRNPLAAIYGGAEMLVDSENLSPQQSKRLATNIYRASRRIQELLQHLADSARGRVEPSEMCRMADVIGAAQEVLMPMAERQHVQIQVDVADDLELPLERSRMERVFLNLMSNSLEAMPDGGRLTVTAHRDNGFAVVVVDDTGTGISEEVRKHLFQPFVTAGKRHGLGLGLALSRQTVIDHGGELWADSKPAPGARLCLRVPLTTMSERIAPVETRV